MNLKFQGGKDYEGNTEIYKYNKSIWRKEKYISSVKWYRYEVFEGEFVGVMGPSGAGKSTLLNIISTIDRPTGGKILIDGDDITKLKGDKLSDFRRNKLGFIFQDFNLLDTLTVKENIALPLSLSKLSYKKQIKSNRNNRKVRYKGFIK